MKTLKTISSTQKLSEKFRQEGKTIGFVPTMGYLHEGHISLIKGARKKADIVFASIFVNPLQFGPKEDFKKYPRNFKRDEKLCKDAGVDYIFYPDVKELYPEGFSTYVDVENMTNILEGEIRPGHFRGVTTVVLKLFNIVNPHFAFFGQKDAQQAAIIKKMTSELNLNLNINISPTVREKDGLAMSSRNVYLTPEQRKDAAILYRTLVYAGRKLKEGYYRDIGFLKQQMYKLIKSKPAVTKIDYISFNDNITLEVVKTLKNLKKKNNLLISLAVRFGNTRLIDNIVIKY